MNCEREGKGHQHWESREHTVVWNSSAQEALCCLVQPQCPHPPPQKQKHARNKSRLHVLRRLKDSLKVTLEKKEQGSLPKCAPRAV